MATIHYLSLIIFLIKIISSEVTFESLCSSDVYVNGMSSIDGNDEFEIDPYETKFLPEDTILLTLKQKRSNYGINEFVLRAFDQDGNIVGRFDDQQTGSLALQHHTCPNGASVIYVDKAEPRGYSKIPLAWKASGIHNNFDQVVFKADVISNRQLYRVKSKPLKRRLASGVIPYADDQSINLDHCGESQGCLIVPQNCNNNPKCEYALAWQVLDEDTAKFHIIARAQGFAGVGFSKDENRGDDQVVICTRDSQGHIYVHNMFVGVEIPRHILQGRRSYGLQDADGYSNGTHIICKFVRKLSPHSDTLVENDGRNRDEIDRDKFIDLKQSHYMYPIYSNQDLQTPEGMRIPLQNIPIVNNHAINFERRIWPKSHPRAGSVLAKIHAILNIIAWVLLASVGVMVARYFDLVWPEYERGAVVDGSRMGTEAKPLRRNPFSYFTIFPPLMFIVAILTWCAFFCILFELNWKWTHGTHHMWHSILGVIVLICAFFAPIISIMRPIPYTKRYCVWYWIHWLIVSIAHCLAIPVIFLGMDNRRLDLWTWCSWLLFGWCIFHLIIQLIFEIHACCFTRREYERFEERDYNSEKRSDHRVRRERIPGATWQPALLGIYIFVTLVVVIILVIAVILYQGY